MATSSFNKSFMLDSEMAIESFYKMISNPCKSKKIDKGLTSPEEKRKGEMRLKEMLFNQEI